MEAIELDILGVRVHNQAQLTVLLRGLNTQRLTRTGGSAPTNLFADLKTGEEVKPDHALPYTQPKRVRGRSRTVSKQKAHKKVPTLKGQAVGSLDARRADMRAMLYHRRSEANEPYSNTAYTRRHSLDAPASGALSSDPRAMARRKTRHKEALADVARLRRELAEMQAKFDDASHAAQGAELKLKEDINMLLLAFEDDAHTDSCMEEYPPTIRPRSFKRNDGLYEPRFEVALMRGLVELSYKKAVPFVKSIYRLAG